MFLIMSDITPQIASNVQQIGGPLSPSYYIWFRPGDCRIQCAFYSFNDINPQIDGFSCIWNQKWPSRDRFSTLIQDQLEAAWQRQHSGHSGVRTAKHLKYPNIREGPRLSSGVINLFSLFMILYPRIYQLLILEQVSRAFIAEIKSRAKLSHITEVGIQGVFITLEPGILIRARPNMIHQNLQWFIPGFCSLCGHT